MAGYALPAELEERQVLASCRAGHQDGLDLLYRRYAPALVQFCERRLGGIGDAEDAAHEAILKAHRAMPRFREGARLWPWLATIAANVCTDMQRSRDRLSPEQDAVDWLAPEVDEDVSRRLRASIVDSALEELPERFRTPLFLREFMGWSYEEIAGFSNKSIGSVRTNLMRARRAFQAQVEDVARRRGQWPLPAAVVGGWRRLRATLRSWRDAAARLGSDGAAALWRAEGVLAAMIPGVQMAFVAVVVVVGGSAALAPAAAAPAAATVPVGIVLASTSATTPADSAIGGQPTPSLGDTAAPRATRQLVDADSTSLAPTGPPVEGDAWINESEDGTASIEERVAVQGPVGPPVVFEGYSDVTKCHPTNSKVYAAKCEAYRTARDATGG